MNYGKYFRETWIPVYIKQIKENKKPEVIRAIRENVYKNVHLTIKEKDNIWNEIMRRSNNEGV